MDDIIPLVKLKGIFLNLGFKAKILVLAAIIAVVTLPSGIFLYIAETNGDKGSVSDIARENESSIGTVAGESTQNSQNSPFPSSTPSKKASPSPSSLSNQHNQSANSGGNNPSNTALSNNSQNSTSGQSSSPFLGSSVNSPSPSPSPDSTPFTANLEITNYTVENNNGNFSAVITANKDLTNCSYDFGMLAGGGLVNGKICEVGGGQTNLRLLKVDVGAISGETLHLEHKF